MRVWLPQFSLRRTELTSGLFGSLVGKPLQCCSRCRRERAQAHRWTHTHTHTRAGTCTNTRPCRAHNISNINTGPRALAPERKLCAHAYRCKCKYRCGESLFFGEKNTVILMHGQTHIDTNPSPLCPPPPDGDRVAADVAAEPEHCWHR